jgi:hypothetical protein
MLVYALYQKNSPLGAVAASFREGFGPLFSSPFLVVLISIAFLNFTAAIIDQVVATAGVPVGNVSGDALPLLIGFTTSPLIEEIGFRVLLVGVVAAILCMGRSSRIALKALWRPSFAIEGLAVGSGASIIVWAAMGFSAVTFGACHVVCGNSWQIGKLPEATYGGVVLGYLYVRYGLHVAVLAHWGVDYFGSIYAFFGQAAYGIPWNSNTSEFIGQYLVDWDMLILFGLASFLVVLYVGLKKTLEKRTELQTVELDGGGPVPWGNRVEK